MAVIAVYQQWEPENNTKVLRTYWFVDAHHQTFMTREPTAAREERWPMGWGPWRSPNAH